MNKPLPSQERLHELFTYSVITGLLYWLSPTSNRVKVGDVAGNKQPNGYYRVKVDGEYYMMNRIIYRYVTGVDVGEDEVHHEDDNPGNNSWHNLYHLTHGENIRKRNDVTFIRKIREGCYAVRVMKKHIGVYKTLEEAQRKVKEMDL